MVYVGIDIASEKHACCILDENSKHPLAEFEFENSASGFAILLREISRHALPGETKIGLEATGIYGTNLSEFLRRNGFEITTFNPLLLKNRARGTTLRKTKTDKYDANFIARTLMQEAVQPDTDISYHTLELKSLTRLRSQLVENRSKAKIRAKVALTVIFPEFLRAFSDIFGAASVATLRKYPCARDLAKCRKATLSKLLATASRGQCGEAKAQELIGLAKNSIGTYSAARVIALQVHLDEIQMYSAHIAALDRQIKEIMDEINSPILSIPGIGYVLGATILAEIGDIRRFSSPDKLVSFAGIEPSIYQSGKYTGQGSMVKRGSPRLRWALILAARLVSNVSLVFSVYMEKKLAEGKAYNVATSHVAKKLVRVIFALLYKNTSFSDTILPSAA